MTDEIPTETRERTHVETSIEETTETYEVAECEWCEGEHPVEQTVPIGIGERETHARRELATVTHKYHRHAAGAAVNISPSDDVSVSKLSRGDRVPDTYPDKILAHSQDVLSDTRRDYVLTDTAARTEPEHTVAFCGYCARSLAEVMGLDLDIDVEMDEPAADAYADFDFGQPVADTDTDDDFVSGSDWGTTDDGTDMAGDPLWWLAVAMVQLLVGVSTATTGALPEPVPSALIATVLLTGGLSLLSYGPFALAKRVLSSWTFWILVTVGSLVTILVGPLVAPSIPAAGWGMVALVQCILGGLLSERVRDDY